MDDQSSIQDQMENTRTALADKLEKLESTVTNTVQEATQEVAQTVTTVTDTVQDTVQTVRETVDDTLTSVKESIDVFKSMFDIPNHVDRHPWVVMGGSVAVGFVLGELLARGNRPAQQSVSSQSYDNRGAGNHESNGHAKASSNDSADTDGLFDKLAPEIAKLKGLALGALMGTIREMVANIAGDDLGQSLSEIIDSVTTKIGGTPLPSGSKNNDEQTNSQEETPYAEIDRDSSDPATATRRHRFATAQ